MIQPLHYKFKNVLYVFFYLGFLLRVTTNLQKQIGHHQINNKNVPLCKFFFACVIFFDLFFIYSIIHMFKTFINIR